MAEGIVVEQVEPARTYALRREVLRPWLSLEQMTTLFDDDGPGTGLFGAIDLATGDVVGTASVLREAPPPGLLEDVAPASGADAWRLRGMATREGLRGQGIGAQVLAGCVEHVAERGGGFLWCNARMVARHFYESCGFTEWGEEFESVGIPHVVMWRMVEAEESGT